MKLVEIRELDGPNIFLLAPAIKVELAVDSDQDLYLASNRLGASIAAQNQANASDPLACFCLAVEAWIQSLFESLQLTGPTVIVRRLDTPGRVALSFNWEHRRFARQVAESLAEIAVGSGDAIPMERFQELLTNRDADDSPEWVRDTERTMPAVGITGTNGKTTTTRLLAHMLMATGKPVGWSSSSGVYIDGSEVLTGDYSGPSGARRVLLDPGVDIAVLETARGGILLRGIAYESNDVSVFTNVSADHLDLQGITTVEGLAEVKAVVVRMTSPAGTAVLNADDPLVVSSTADAAATRIYFSRDQDNPTVREHLAQGGKALVAGQDAIVLHDSDDRKEVAKLSDIPMTFSGRARHMIENAMAATGAAIGLGLSIEQIASGLRTFHNSPEHNLGRLNVFDLGGVTAIMDFAHNEVGLDLLIDFARRFVTNHGSLTVIIGTAGDRTAQSLREIGRIAASRADHVIIKHTPKYLRGRTIEQMIELYQEGAHEAGKPDAAVADNELIAMTTALDAAQAGDVVAIMCQELMLEVHELLTARGKPIS